MLHFLYLSSSLQFHSCLFSQFPLHCKLKAVSVISFSFPVPFTFLSSVSLYFFLSVQFLLVFNYSFKRQCFSYFQNSSFWFALPYFIVYSCLSVPGSLSANSYSICPQKYYKFFFASDVHHLWRHFWVLRVHLYAFICTFSEWRDLHTSLISSICLLFSIANPSPKNGPTTQKEEVYGLCIR